MLSINWYMPHLARHTYEEISADQAERLSRMRKAQLAYDGKFPPSLRVKSGQPDDNVRLNFARMLVRAGVAFLFGEPFQVEERIDGRADKKKTPAEELIEATLHASGGMTLFQKAATNGGVLGHCFIKIIDQSPLTAPYPRLIVLDPAMVEVRTAPEDCEDAVAYTLHWRDVDANGKAIERRQRVERQGEGMSATWLIIDEKTPVGSTRWEQISSQVWPHPLGPIVDCQNLNAANTFWGEPDLDDDLIDLNQSINFLSSNLMRVVKFHGHPKTWGKGFNASQMDAAADGLLILNNPDAMLDTLQPVTDLSSHIELWRALKSSMHQIAAVPEIAAGEVDDVGQLSGLALQILYGPLVQQTAVKRLLYGRLITGIARRILMLAGLNWQTNLEIIWPEPLPTDPNAEATGLRLDKELGASDDTLLRKRGYDPDEERTKREAQQPTMMPIPPTINQPSGDDDDDQ